MEEIFDEWTIRVAPEITECGEVARKRIPAGQNLYASYLEELLDISGVALSLLEKAKDFHHNKVAEILQGYESGGNPKTKIDAAYKTPCMELTMVTRLQSINDTISLRTNQAQSVIKAYCK